MSLSFEHNFANILIKNQFFNRIAKSIELSLKLFIMISCTFLFFFCIHVVLFLSNMNYIIGSIFLEIFLFKKHIMEEREGNF